MTGAAGTITIILTIITGMATRILIDTTTIMSMMAIAAVLSLWMRARNLRQSQS